MGRSLNDFLNGNCAIEDAAYDVTDAARGEGVEGVENLKAIYLTHRASRPAILPKSSAMATTLACSMTVSATWSSASTSTIC